MNLIDLLLSFIGLGTNTHNKETERAVNLLHSRIIEYGLYKQLATGAQHLEEIDKLGVGLGDMIGVSYEVNADGDATIETCVTVHLPNGTTDVYPGELTTNTSRIFNWTFGEEEELIPGKWVFEISFPNNPELETLKQKFKIKINPNNEQNKISIEAKDESSIEDLIVPIVKHADYVPANQARNGITLAHIPYNEELTICFGYDYGMMFKYVNESDLNDLSITMDAFLTKAITNFSGKVGLSSKEMDDNLYGVMCTDSTMTSSFLLHTEMIKDLLEPDGKFYESLGAKNISGNTLLGVPSRDFVIIGDSAQAARMQEIVNEIYEEKEKYYISNKLFKWNGEKFEVYSEK